MTEAKTFTSFVIGEPRPQQRPRARTLPGGKRTVMYVPKCTWRRSVRRQLQSDVIAQGFAPLECACVMRVTIHIGRPKYHYGTGRNARKLKPSAPEWPIASQSGDVDNFAKALLDAANGILYSDDVQVVELCIRKVYGEEPGALIECRPAGSGLAETTF